MRVKDIDIGKIFVTDAEFGSVDVGDPTFISRLADHRVDIDQVSWMKQTHSNHVAVVDRAVILDDTDAMITRSDRLILVTRTADCVPLLMWDLATRTIAVVHAGRAGFLKGIVQSALDTLADLGCRPADLRCFLGPHLRTDHHEVSPEIVDQVSPELVDVVVDRRDGKVFFDLTSGVTTVLTRAGVRGENIEDCGIDTYGDSRYFSYRKMRHEGDEKSKTQRFASCIMLSP